MSESTTPRPDDNGDDAILKDFSKGVARISFNRPSKRNAITFSMLQRLRSELSLAKLDADVRVVILQGIGDLAFCSGMDLSQASDEDVPMSTVHEVRAAVSATCNDLWELGKPTIAKVQGWALGGGFGLALACDLIVASDRSRFGAPEINVGLWPQVIAVPMIRAMPRRTALDLMITGRVVDGVEGERIGFVNRLVAHEKLDDAVNELATALASKSRVAMRQGRDLFYSLWDASTAEAIAELQKDIQMDDLGEGITAFLEKRPPVWTEN